MPTGGIGERSGSVCYALRAIMQKGVSGIVYMYGAERRRYTITVINNGEEKTSVVWWLFGFFVVKKIVRKA
jgi:hypothetical protein